VADITYVPTAQGFLYLAAVMDDATFDARRRQILSVIQS
jgi:hypothetical protein